MKHIYGFLFVLMSFCVHADRSDSPWNIKELEYLFSNMKWPHISAVTHSYGSGDNLHDYFLACVVTGRQKYIGLLSNDWNHCYVRNEKNEIKCGKNFSHLIKNNQDLSEIAKYATDRPDRKKSRGYWRYNHEASTKRVPCLEWIVKTKKAENVFCLSSEAAVRYDFWWRSTLWVTGAFVITLFILRILWVCT